MKKQLLSLAFLSAAAIFAMPVLASADSASSCSTNTAIYGTPGNYTFTVPTGVTGLRVFVSGGGGGGGAGSGGWGSGGGGGCSGGIAGGTMTVTPGQKIPLYVGYGGTGGNGSNQNNPGGCPWCGSYSPSSDGSTGGSSGIGAITAVGGGWGRTGFHNLFDQYAGGTGGGSGGGGGGNGWPGYSAIVGSGGTAGSETNSQGAGGYCTSDGWSIDPGTYITKVPWTAGVGGQEPAVASYYGGGGGGGVVINGSTVNGSNAPGGCSWGCPGTGGAGYGGGGGGQGLDYTGAGGAGAPGVVYIEWDGGNTNSCALSCSVTFDQNPLTGNYTKVRWTSQNASLFYINNIGYVPASGSAQISSPGDYSGSVSGIGITASCPAVLTGTTNSCGTPQTCQADGNLKDACGNRTVCRYGCSLTTDQCNASASCQPYNVCDAENNKVINGCDGSVVNDCSARGLMCSAGACVPPVIGFTPFDAVDFNNGAFTATGHLQAFPPLVHQGETTRIYWNVSNARSCSVVGNNGDSWTGLLSGASGKTTAPVTARTTYTLLCNALTGATPPTVQETATVNILPVFQER